MIGTEDCLYLSVFTPDLPVTENQARMPVVVWLFDAAESFSFGDASEEHYDPAPIMDESRRAGGGVVVVAVSFRVGPFGLLCLGCDDVPGNMVRTYILISSPAPLIQPSALARRSFPFPPSSASLRDGITNSSKFSAAIAACRQELSHLKLVAAILWPPMSANMSSGP